MSRLKKISWLKNLARVGLGLGLGLVITEIAFRYRDGGAFAHVNFYQPDAALGARLTPGAKEKLRFGSPANPITSVRINGEGYRGAAWPAPASDEVVVVGDSQAFGLGVEENETFSAVLAHALGDKTVRNLGVPTYGPAEYNAILAEQLAKRPAKTVIWIANMANDLFEASHPNTARHVIWDGWAVRKESAPAHVTQFPGRALLYTDSHAFLAARRWLYAQGPQDSDAGFASEGTWKDVGTAANGAEKEHVVAEKEADRRAREHSAAVQKATADAHDQDGTVEGIVRNGATDADYRAFVPNANVHSSDEDATLSGEDYLYAARRSPGDIVSVGFTEGGRSVRLNAQQIQRGVALRNAVAKKVREKAERSGDKKTLGEFAKLDALKANATKLAAEPARKPIVLSPLAPALKEAKAICDKAGARLLVVALPIDVQVSKEEWKKYKTEAIDMGSSRILNADVVVAADAIGADGFDALPALAAAEPGAFLDGDLHMTPKGHRALGEAIAKAITTPKLATPDDGLPLPANRSRPPLRSEWIPEAEIAVVESDPAGCETKQIREWVGIFCRNKGGARGVKVDRGIDVLAGALPGEAQLIAPVIAGQDLHAVFAFDGASREFTIKDAKIVGFSKAQPARADLVVPVDAAYLKCAKDDISKRTAPADADCTRTYVDDCKRMLACAAGEPDAPPSCAAGAAHAGAAGRCRLLCSPAVACGAGNGSCTPWAGGDVCM